MYNYSFFIVYLFISYFFYFLLFDAPKIPLKTDNKKGRAFSSLPSFCFLLLRRLFCLSYALRSSRLILPSFTAASRSFLLLIVSLLYSFKNLYKYLLVVLLYSSALVSMMVAPFSTFAIMV